MGRTYVVVIGYAGAYKAADIIVEHEKELRSIYRSSFVDSMIYSHAAATANVDAACLAMGEVCAAAEAGMEVDPHWPGVHFHGYLGALYDLAQERGCGINVMLRRIPLLQSTVEVCETYSLNPYTLPTYAGIFLTEDPEGFLQMCVPEPQHGEATSHGTRSAAGVRQPWPRDMAACVGYLTEGPDKIIIDKTNIEYMNKIR